MGMKNMAEKNTRVHAQLGQNFKNVTISSNFRLKWVWKVIYLSQFKFALKKH